ncbi:MAG: hypothetical protein AAGC64_10410 [Bacteroidota bacterium]
MRLNHEIRDYGYLFEKLRIINYRMAIDEGDARTRLSAYCFELHLLATRDFPDKFKCLHTELKNFECSRNGVIHGLRNKRASGIIEKLLDLEIFLS